MNMKIWVLTGFLYLLKLTKLLERSIFRIQTYDSIMCGYLCIEFINYMLKGKTLLDYTNLFSPNDFKNSDQVIKGIFKNE